MGFCLNSCVITLQEREYLRYSAGLSMILLRVYVMGNFHNQANVVYSSKRTSVPKTMKHVTRNNEKVVDIKYKQN